MKKEKKKVPGFIGRALFTLTVAALVYSCANIARPGGGPKDTAPPVFVRSNPMPNTVNFDKKRIDIEFDENIILEKVTEKVIISPAQKEMPVIRANGKRIQIDLVDSLLPNTTYTIDFSDAIVDNNEKNPLRNFSLAFSTGPTIDSLQISGIALDAGNLEPVTGIMVGLHSDLNDSAFITTPMERLAITDAYGRFNVKNVAPGKYRIYALKDMNRDYRFDNPSEDLAFYDSVISPTVEMKLHIDTFWLDSVTVDTVMSVAYPHYYPDNVLLRVFNEQFKSRYIEKNDRPERYKLNIYFAAPGDSLPALTPLNFSEPDWALIEQSENKDTLTYWIKDSLIYNQDTLFFVADYLRTDSLRKLSPYTDTLRFLYKAPRQTHSKKKKEHSDKPVIEFMKIEARNPSAMNVYNNYNFTTEHPVQRLDTAGIRLEQKRDTLWYPVTYRLEQDSDHIRAYRIIKRWVPGEEYRVTIDSAAITGLYGRYNKKLEQTFKVKRLEEYANLYFTVSGVTDSAFVELLNQSDAVVRRAPVRNGLAEFSYVDPGTYYARLFIDRNHNRKYDTGNYAAHLQPEEVFYYPDALNLKANWDVEQDWDIRQQPLFRQKPKALVKNKPKEETDENESDPYDTEGLQAPAIVPVP